MKNRLSHKKYTWLTFVILSVSLSSYYVQADSNPLDSNTQSIDQSLLYPLEESADILKASSTPAASTTKLEPGSEKLFYPNLFQNDLFTPPQQNTATPPPNTSLPNTPTTTPAAATSAPTAPSTVLAPNPTTQSTVPTTQTPATANTPATQPTTAPANTPTQEPASNSSNAPANTSAAQTAPATGPTQPAAPTQPTVQTKTPDEINPKAPNKQTVNSPNTEAPKKDVLINFNNVAVSEYIRFISRISNKNFVFDENDLQFTVTIVSEEPTTIDNIVAALLQELRIHDLDLIEQGNTIIIHKNSKVNGISKVVNDSTPEKELEQSEIVTKVFRLNTLEATRAAVILKPMVSVTALVEVLPETNNLIITDLSTNIREITELLHNLDSPQGGLLIGQYVVTSQQPEVLISTAQKILAPLAHDQKITFIPHKSANSIFVVANPYLVERTLAILKYLDEAAATSQILNPKDLNFTTKGSGQWILDKDGNWQFVPSQPIPSSKDASGKPNANGAPNGAWKVDSQGNWYFEPGGDTNVPGGPDGKWVLDSNGNWVFQLKPGKSISPQSTQRTERNASELPVGHIERTQFSIYKLQYRKGGQIAQALGRIAESLATAGTGTNIDLLQAINSVQWIESSNSLIFTGTPDALNKVKELIGEIDVPLRQVLLEMLILETDITDSLTFSCNVAAAFGGGNTSGAEAFLSGASTLPAGMATTGVGLVPNAQPQISSVTGFVLGIIGQTITHNGTEYASLGGLVEALTSVSTVSLIMNPKILTEDNSPAEIFVGLNTQYPTQSIANNLGTTITQNFEYRDVGTTIKVTPIIGNNDIITLEIQEEVSSIVSGGNTSSNNTTTTVGPTTKINRTTTKVHVPNNFFLILSGQLSDEAERDRNQVPCLGSIPVIGAAFSDKTVKDTKQNVMIFVHPIIIDTEEEMDNITRHNQNVYRVKNRRPKLWVWESDEGMDFFNIIDVDNRDGDEDCY